MAAEEHVGFGAARLAARQLRSQRSFYRGLASHSSSPGCRLIEVPGVAATAFPAAPHSWLFNHVFSFESPAALREALPLLEAEYTDMGVSTWSLSITEHDGPAIEAATRAGFVSAWSSSRMGAFLGPRDLEPRDRLELISDPTWGTVARCNDRAYGLGDQDSISSVLTSIEDPAFRIYAVADGAEPVCALVTREEAGDCYMWFVATVPEARGRKLATELARLAFREGRSRGCQTGSGESTPAAIGIYETLGAVVLGRTRLWTRTSLESADTG